MSFDLTPCSEEDAEYIQEQADRVFDTIAPPEEVAEEEFVYKVTDEKGSLLGGCIKGDRRCKIVLGKKERGRRAKRQRGRPLGGGGS